MDTLAAMVAVILMLLMLAGIVLAVAGVFNVPVVVIAVAVLVILAGSAAVGIDVIRAARSDGDGWIVAIARGTWAAIRMVFDFGF